MTRETVRRGLFIARPESLREARALVESFGEQQGLPEMAVARLNLVVEELFVNTVTHGQAGGADTLVWVTLTRDPGGVRIAYEDQAPPFNAFAAGAVALPGDPSQAEKEGGLGIYLTRTLAGEPEYAYLFGRNRLRFTLPV